MKFPAFALTFPLMRAANKKTQLIFGPELGRVHVRRRFSSAHCARLRYYA